MVNGKTLCFCLPEYEGQPPRKPCRLPKNPCDPSPCGPNTQCTVLENGFSKCTCLAGYLESPNTIRGCMQQRSPCDPNPCGHGAICDPDRQPTCFCPEPSIGNPFRACSMPQRGTDLCQPGPCGSNSECYVVSGREQCYCKSGFIGDPYTNCYRSPHSPCDPNPCAVGAVCSASPSGQPLCSCPDGMGGDPTSVGGCVGYECQTDDDCSADNACMGFRCRNPCPGSCGINAECRVEKHHPVCACAAGLTGHPLKRCYQIQTPLHDDLCNPSPCGINTICQVVKGRPVCSCLPDFLGEPQTGCQAECLLNSDCPEDKTCSNRKCINPCGISICGVNAQCIVRYHTAVCSCPDGYIGDPLSLCQQKRKYKS